MMALVSSYEWAMPIAVAIAAAPLVLVLMPAYVVQRFLAKANGAPADAASELVVMEASIDHLNTRVDAICEKIAARQGDN